MNNYSIYVPQNVWTHGHIETQNVPQTGRHPVPSFNPAHPPVPAPMPRPRRLSNAHIGTGTRHPGWMPAPGQGWGQPPFAAPVPSIYGPRAQNDAMHQQELAQTQAQIGVQVQAQLEAIRRSLRDQNQKSSLYFDVKKDVDTVLKSYEHSHLTEGMVKTIVDEHVQRHVSTMQSSNARYYNEILRNDFDELKQSISSGLMKTLGWNGSSDQENVRWNNGDTKWVNGPILSTDGKGFERLKPEQRDIARGSYGSVTSFRTATNELVIGKIVHPHVSYKDNDVLEKELDAYKRIYRKAGAHPNLINVYGIAQTRMDGERAKVMLMDAVPGGFNGTSTFAALHKCLEVGEINASEFTGAIQFMAKRLFDVAQHMSKAGVVHNDIKPDNFLVSDQTGTPVLIDLGIWTRVNKSHYRGTDWYSAPETTMTEKTDLFAVAASIFAGFEDPQGMGYLKNSTGKRKLPKDGMERQEHVLKGPDGYPLRLPGVTALPNSSGTAYTRFLSQLLRPDSARRPNGEEIQQTPFLADSMLGDEEAKRVLVRVIEYAKTENAKPDQEKWQAKHVNRLIEVIEKKSPQEQRESITRNRIKSSDAEFNKDIEDLKRTPTLTKMALLFHRNSKDFSRKYSLSLVLKQHFHALHDEADRMSAELSEDADAFYSTWKFMLERPPLALSKAGVDSNGISIPEEAHANTLRSQGISAQGLLLNLDIKTIEEIEDYRDRAEKFLGMAFSLLSLADDLENERKWHQKQGLHNPQPVSFKVGTELESNLSKIREASLIAQRIAYVNEAATVEANPADPKWANARNAAVVNARIPPDPKWANARNAAVVNARIRNMEQVNLQRLTEERRDRLHRREAEIADLNAQAKTSGLTAKFQSRLNYLQKDLAFLKRAGLSPDEAKNVEWDQAFLADLHHSVNRRGQSLARILYAQLPAERETPSAMQPLEKLTEVLNFRTRNLEMLKESMSPDLNRLAKDRKKLTRELEKPKEGDVAYYKQKVERRETAIEKKIEAVQKISASEALVRELEAKIQEERLKKEQLIREVRGQM